MSNLSKYLKEDFKKHYFIDIPQIVDISICKKDNSYKFLLIAKDGNLIESILILKRDRATVCVSCMVGCPLGCKFCATGSE